MRVARLDGACRRRRRRDRRRRIGASPTSSSCWAATERCCGRCSAVSGTGVPVLGVNFGRVGFLTSIDGADLEAGLARAFAGEYAVLELATLDVEAGGQRAVSVNDVVATSATLGRMVELEWQIGDESLGSVACDGVICSTPTGSTAYNLSNGGPVLVWGLDAMAVTFVAPHSLHARSLVVPRSRDVRRAQPNSRRRRHGARRRPRARGARDRRDHVRPARRSPCAARRAAGGDVRQPLPRDLCFVGSASRTSSSSARRSSSSLPA